MFLFWSEFCWSTILDYSQLHALQEYLYFIEILYYSRNIADYALDKMKSLVQSYSLLET